MLMYIHISPYPHPSITVTMNNQKPIYKYVTNALHFEIY